MVIYIQHILSIGFLCLLSFLLKRSGCYIYSRKQTIQCIQCPLHFTILISEVRIRYNRDMLCINMKSYKILYILRCEFFILRYLMCFLKGMDAGQMLYATIYRS